MAVQQEVERAILAGEYAPGDKLNEAALRFKSWLMLYRGTSFPP